MCLEYRLKGPLEIQVLTLIFSVGKITEVIQFLDFKEKDNKYQARARTKQTVVRLSKTIFRAPDGSEHDCYKKKLIVLHYHEPFNVR